MNAKMKRPARKAVSQSGDKSGGSWPKSLLVGLGAACIVTALLAVMMPLILVNQDDPNTLVAPAALVIAALGGFTAGFAGAKVKKQNGLAAAMVDGVIFLIVLCLLSYCFENAGGSDAGILYKIGVAVILLAGAFLGGKLGAARKRRHGH